MWITCSACHQKVLNWLKSHKQFKLTLMPQRTDKNEALQATKAAILCYMLILYPTTERFVHSNYLNLLINILDIKRTNWASLTLNHLKRSIVSFQHDKVNLKGNQILLRVISIPDMLWYWEKFRVIRVLAPGNRHETVISGTSFYRSSCGLFMLKCMEHWNGSKLTTKFKQIFRRKLAAILVSSASNDNTEIPTYKK
uniref:Uncharacterized protein n=1 Tax=Oryza glumipatula TaxID=40148 RepID=A0A0D9ZK29_9ORYZ